MIVGNVSNRWTLDLEVCLSVVTVYENVVSYTL